MNCSQARKRLAAELDSSGEDRDARAHAEACDECRGFLELLDGSDAVLRSLGPSVPPADLAARAAAAALDAGNEPALHEPFLDRLLPVAWPAAAVAVVVAVILLFGNGTGTTTTEPAAQEDPVAAVTELPPELSNPVLGLMGGE